MDKHFWFPEIETLEAGYQVEITALYRLYRLKQLTRPVRPVSVNARQAKRVFLLPYPDCPESLNDLYPFTIDQPMFADLVVHFLGGDRYELEVKLERPFDPQNQSDIDGACEERSPQPIVDRVEGGDVSIRSLVVRLDKDGLAFVIEASGMVTQPKGELVPLDRVAECLGSALGKQVSTSTDVISAPRNDSLAGPS